MKENILHEDEYCLVVNKPSDLIVHHSYYARNIEEQSLVQLLNEVLGFPVYPVHRLDRKTSGVILFCKSKEKVSAFQALFEKNEVQKKYRALLRGHTASSGKIDSPVKNDRGNYREAATRFSTIQHYLLKIPVVPYEVSRYSIVEFLPETGRMHQLRIHANKISHPIINDPKYGNRHHNHMFTEQLGISHLFLHAFSLGFVHPFNGENIFVSAALPEFWELFLSHRLLEKVEG